MKIQFIIRVIVILWDDTANDNTCFDPVVVIDRSVNLVNNYKNTKTRKSHNDNYCL